MLAENPLSFCLICQYKYFHNFIYFISRDIVIFGLAGNTGECEKLRPHQCVHSNLKKKILSRKVAEVAQLQYHVRKSNWHVFNVELLFDFTSKTPLPHSRRLHPASPSLCPCPPCLHAFATALPLSTRQCQRPLDAPMPSHVLDIFTHAHAPTF